MRVGTCVASAALCVLTSASPTCGPFPRCEPFLAFTSFRIPGRKYAVQPLCSGVRLLSASVSQRNGGFVPRELLLPEWVGQWHGVAVSYGLLLPARLDS
jgi:hypothetical protein